MKTLIFTILTLISGLAMAVETVDERFALKGKGNVEITHQSGEAKVTAWDKNEVWPKGMREETLKTASAMTVRKRLNIVLAVSWRSVITVAVPRWIYRRFLVALS